jgi:hypothetical protein
MSHIFDTHHLHDPTEQTGPLDYKRAVVVDAEKREKERKRKRKPLSGKKKEVSSKRA